MIPPHRLFLCGLSLFTSNRYAQPTTASCSENINGPASDKVPVHKLSHLEHRDDLLAVEYRQQSFVCADVALFLGILELVFADVLPKLFGQFGPGEWVFADHCGQCGV